jgi:hypothetical protein
MSNFLIGCVTFLLLCLIVQIKNILKNKNTKEIKKYTVEALKEIKIKALDEGIAFEKLDLEVFEKILEQEQEEDE